MHDQCQKSEQKPTTKNFVGFQNHTPLLTIYEHTKYLQSCSSVYRHRRTFSLHGVVQRVTHFKRFSLATDP